MSIVSSIIRVNYRVVRAPADLVRRKVLTRLPEDSLVRLGADGAIGLLDAVVGRITGDEELRERGGAMAKDLSAALQARTSRPSMSPDKAMTPPPSEPETKRYDLAGGLEIDPYMAT